MVEYVKFKLQGNNKQIWEKHDAEILAEGPAGTGKTRTILEKIFHLDQKYPGYRGCIVRKTRTSMTQSVLKTFEKKVLPNHITLHTTNQSYTLPNGSEIVVGGMDKPEKILSSEYDIIYVNECTELKEDEWETLKTRLRNGVIPYQQLIADCNPADDKHWLNQRASTDLMQRIITRHEDNPLYYDESKAEYTAAGKEYVLGILESLTGLRYLRYRKGIWAKSEGLIYGEFDPSIHVVDRFDIPDSWQIYRSIDFGYTNPFVCQWWTVDHDGRMYLFREVYKTQRTVRAHAIKINQYEKDVDSVSDHGANERATLEEHGIYTTAALKDVTSGIDAVKERLKIQGDGKPRLFIMRDSLVETDEELKRNGRPTCTLDEFSSYIWHPKIPDKPNKEDDHGMDAMRYMVMHLASYQPAIW